MGADHLPSVQEALGWISNTEEGVWGVEGEEGRKEGTKVTWRYAIPLWFQVASSPKCKRMDRLQLGGSFVFAWTPPPHTHPNVPQTCAACVSWKRAIRLPFQTELIS